MAETKDLKIVITSDSKDAQHDIEQFGGSMNGISPIGVALGNILADVAEKAVQLGKTFITSSVSAFEESEKSIAQLNAVLKSTHGAAGLFIEDITDQAKALQNLTTYSDEQIQSAQALMLTFTNVKGAVLQDSIPAILDMSTALGQDLKSSSIQLGKALQDPILGITALRRVGVNFSESQRDVIKNLVETGKVVDAQRMILREINTEFGGSASAAANTFAGKLEQLKNKFNDIQEVIGKIIVNAIFPLVKAIDPVLTAIQNAVNGTGEWSDVISALNKLLPNFGTAIQVIWQLLQSKMTPIMKELKDLWDKHHESITLLATTLVTVLFAALIAVIEITAHLIEIIIKATDIVLSFGEAFHKFSLMVKDAMSATLGYIKDMVNGAIGLINKLIEGFNSVAGKVPGASKNTISKIPALAQGTDYFEGGMALVGERGAELVTLPKGSSVTPANETAKMMGQTTVNIYNPVVRSDNDIQSIVQQIKQVLGRQDELARLRAI